MTCGPAMTEPLAMATVCLPANAVLLFPLLYMQTVLAVPPREEIILRALLLVWKKVGEFTRVPGPVDRELLYPIDRTDREWPRALYPSLLVVPVVMHSELV